jgi:hypothetical protein
MRNKILTTAAMLAFALNAHAQVPENHPAEGRLKPIEKPTTFTPLDHSMADYLTDGWNIVSGGAGPVFILHKDRWMLCAVDDGQMSGSAPSSQCFALN